MVYASNRELWRSYSGAQMKPCDFLFNSKVLLPDLVPQKRSLRVDIVSKHTHPRLGEMRESTYSLKYSSPNTSEQTAIVSVVS